MNWQQNTKVNDRIRLAMALVSVLALVLTLLSWRQYGFPWLLAQLPVTAVFILLLAFRSTVMAAMLGKLVFDVLFVSLHFFVGFPDLLPLYGTVYLTALCWFILNLFYLENRPAHFLLLVFVLTPFLHRTGLWWSGGKPPEPVAFLAGLVPAMLHLWWVVWGMEKERRAEVLAELERRSLQVEDFRRWSRTSGALLLHDARNILQATSFVDAAVERGECPAEVGERMRRMKHQLLSVLENHDREERAELPVASILRRMFQASPPGLGAFEIKVEPKATLVYHPQVFESLVYNLARNAWEAWHEKSASWRGLRIAVSYDSGELRIEDNAGGFHPTDIQNGASRKGPGHGVFLATVREQQTQLGIRFDLERREAGMLARIVFSPVGIPDPPP